MGNNRRYPFGPIYKLKISYLHVKGRTGSQTGIEDS